MVKWRPISQSRSIDYLYFVQIGATALLKNRVFLTWIRGIRIYYSGRSKNLVLLFNNQHIFLCLVSQFI
uniref:Uncharacterized protein n=1 Tax=Manihot esculenta TaxID=3983 RepID=A0A2C9UCR3_MANES